MGNTCIIQRILILSVSLVKHVMSQCSEAHNTACSQPLTKLKNYDEILYPIGGFVPDYNETTLSDICNLFKEYKNCSVPYFSNCDKQSLTEFHILDSAFTPVCNNLLSDYVKHRLCFQRLKNIYQTCQKQRDEKLKTQEPDDTHYKLHMCTVTTEYVSCSFTVTAVMCSLEAANLYFNIVNESLSMLLSTTGFSCSIRHPNDVIKLITTTTSTTTVTSEIRTTKTTTPINRTFKPINVAVVEHFRLLTIFVGLIVSFFIKNMSLI